MKIKVNMDAIEAMLFYWHSVCEKEKVSDQYIWDITELPGLKLAYDDEFNAESVRKLLSAISNREAVSKDNQKEGRFWNNNMWMTEDLSFTDMMVQPIKQLNVDDMPAILESRGVKSSYDELEVIFSPLHTTEYLINDNKLIINFFRIMPDFETGEAKIDGKDLKEYILDKLQELCSK